MGGGEDVAELVTMATEEGNDGAGLCSRRPKHPPKATAGAGAPRELEFRINRRRAGRYQPSFCIVTLPAREIPTRVLEDLIWATCPARCAADSAFWLDERDMEMAWSDAIAEIDHDEP